MEKLKPLIYKLFDREGIRVRAVSQTSTIFREDDTYETITRERYIPINERYDLQIEDYKQLIVDYIYDTTSIDIKCIDNIDQYSSLNRLPFILKLNEYDFNNTIFSLAFGVVPGSVVFRNEHNINTLGNIEEIKGTLGISGSFLESFGLLKKVTGSFWISNADVNTGLTDLNNIEVIGGSLLLRGYPLKSLNKLKSVGGTLNLRSTNIESLGDLEYIGEHLYLPKSKKGYFDLSKIVIMGKIKYFTS